MGAPLGEASYTGHSIGSLVWEASCSWPLLREDEKLALRLPKTSGLWDVSGRTLSNRVEAPCSDDKSMSSPSHGARYGARDCLRARVMQ